MLMVLSQPFFRQRHAVHEVTPICSNHFDRLMTVVVGCVEFKEDVFIEYRTRSLESISDHKFYFAFDRFFVERILAVENRGFDLTIRRAAVKHFAMLRALQLL